LDELLAPVGEELYVSTTRKWRRKERGDGREQKRKTYLAPVGEELYQARKKKDRRD
jgi:hypothetical protein